MKYYGIWELVEDKPRPHPGFENNTVPREYVDESPYNFNEAAQRRLRQGSSWTEP